MNFKTTCTTLGIAALSAAILSSCSSSTPKGATKTSDTTAAADSKSETVQDEKIYPFMLGGIYFFNGYGGPDRVFNQMIKPEVHKAPGEKGFVAELETAYVKYFVFPLKRKTIRVAQKQRLRLRNGGISKIKQSWRNR